MSVPLPNYAKVKDKYCIAYFGNCNEYIVQLKLLRPYMEKTFPGIQVYIACKDDVISLLKDAANVVPRSQLNPEEFGYVRELTCDMQSHPVESFLKESGVPLGPVPVATPVRSRKCVLVTQGFLPTRSLTQEETRLARNSVANKGCLLTIDGDIANAEYVIGVESDKLFQAGANGAQVTLIPTGFGENIFKCMYPKGTVVKF